VFDLINGTSVWNFAGDDCVVDAGRNTDVIAGICWDQQSLISNSTLENVTKNLPFQFISGMPRALFLSLTILLQALNLLHFIQFWLLMMDLSKYHSRSYWRLHRPSYKMI
jgi:hypothetical protein